MAPIATLYTYPALKKGLMIKAVAAQAGLEIELAPFERGVTNKSTEFLSKFPLGKVPALECADGFKIYESAPIARYLASIVPESGLLGNSLEEAVLVDQWAHVAETELYYYDQAIRSSCQGALPYSKAMENVYYQRLENCLAALESHLATHTFFVGERITLADITVATYILKAVASTIDASRRPKYPNLLRHLETVINQPNLKDTYPPVEYTEKQIHFVPPAKEKKEKIAQ